MAKDNSKGYKKNRYRDQPLPPGLRQRTQGRNKFGRASSLPTKPEIQTVVKIVLAWHTGEWKTSLRCCGRGLTGVPNKLTSSKLLAGVLMIFVGSCPNAMRSCPLGY